MSRNNINEDSGIVPVQDFIELGDVPNSYVGQAGLYPLVNPTEDGLIFGNAVGPPGPPATELFISLTDGPQNYGTSGQYLSSGTGNIRWLTPSFTSIDQTPNALGSNVQYLSSNATSTIWQQPSLLGLSDTPGFYGSNTQYLKSSGNGTLWFTPSFTDLNGTPASYGSNGTVLISNGSGTVFTSLPGLTETYVDLNNLRDVSGGYGSNGYVLTSNGSGWTAQPPSSSGGSQALITLTDYTGSGYVGGNSTTKNAVVGVNNNNNGFTMFDSIFLQRSTPYINFGMCKGMSAYPGKPVGFTYYASDREGGGGGNMGYFYFATNRTNYNEAQYLNDYWNTLNLTGQTQAMYGLESNGDLNQVTHLAPGSNPFRTCGIQITFPSPYSTNYPGWYADIEYSISATIVFDSTGGGGIFCLWVQPESVFNSPAFNVNSYSTAVSRADVFHLVSSGLDTFSFSVRKVITIDSNDYSNINVYMQAFTGDLSTLANGWVILSYDYINISAKMIGMHPNLGASSLPFPPP